MTARVLIFIVLQVACGLNHTLALSVDGNTVWAFGDGDYGKLGLENSTAKPSPLAIETFAGVGVKKVCCGTQFSVVLTRDGRLFTFGQGIFGFILCKSYTTNQNKYIYNQTAELAA